MEKREMIERARIRREQVVKMHVEENWTFKKIGEYFNISPQRAYQLYKEQARS